MKATEFRTWMEAFDRMSRGQRDKLREQLQGKAGGDKGVELTELFSGEVARVHKKATLSAFIPLPLKARCTHNAQP